MDIGRIVRILQGGKLGGIIRRMSGLDFAICVENEKAWRQQRHANAILKEPFRIVFIV